MTRLSHDQYETLERAIIDGTRVAVRRRGGEQVLLPLALRSEGSREIVDARHPVTGEPISFYLDAILSIEVIR